MIGDYPLLEFDSKLIIPSMQYITMSPKEHLEMYPHIFAEDVHLAQFNADMIYNIPETLSLKVLEIIHTGLPIEVITSILIAARYSIEMITIKTNGKCIELIPIAMQMNNVKYIKIYDNTALEDFHKVLEFLSEEFIELHICVSDISGGNGHLYQTRITLVSNTIVIQFVLQYIIISANLQDIFAICINLSTLELSENFNAEFPIYQYVFDADIVFPKKITKLILTDEQFDDSISTQFFNKIPTLACIEYTIHK
jgi:hypothetical protein